MMNTKTIKTPLLMAESCGLTSCTSGLALESSALTLSNLLSRRPEAQYSLVPNPSYHEWQNLGFSSLKNISTMRSCFLVSVANGVFPLMMFSVAKQRVMLTGLVRELAHKHEAMPAARKLEEQNGIRGVFEVFVNNRNLNN